MFLFAKAIAEDHLVRRVGARGIRHRLARREKNYNLWLRTMNTRLVTFSHGTDPNGGSPIKPN